MDIRSMFIKPIDRDIKGVIKVGQTDEENVYEELDEYVVTNQLSRHFRDFFAAYQKSLHEPTDKVGVWISGFFGSGKSHFLKILSYLLKNEQIKGRTPISFFEGKIEDPLVIGNMEQAGRVSADVILFNIDAKSAHDQRSSKEAIVRVFAKVFYEMQGFYGDMLWVADMESALAKEGLYAEFKAVIEELAGRDWKTTRRRILFDRDIVIQALQRVRGMSADAAIEWFKARDENIVLSIENFARTVREYLDSRGPEHRIIFLVDEVGQYIGNNSPMMLELQTIVEELGSFCRGRAWVLVTSQEELDHIVKDVSRGEEIDFSKIQGRFDTRLNLTSANVDEVIKRRLLEKDPTAFAALNLFYGENSAILRNLISFTGGVFDARGFSDAIEFVQVYPFVPYQFNLLQKVFTAIREHASSGRHLASGERSLLSAFQDAAQTYGTDEIGRLVPFYQFYESISSFLDSSISRVIEQAEASEGLQSMDIAVLKLLFMIKYVDEMPARLENITTLMISRIDQDKLTLEKEIQGSLRRLQERTLIQQNGDRYIFLTNEEQEINREIKRIGVEPHRLCSKIGDLIFASDEIYPYRRYRYNSRYNFNFNQMVDGRPRGAQDGEITLQVITPNHDHCDGYGEQDYKALSARNPNDVYLVLPESKRAFVDELTVALQIEEYLRRGSSMQMTSSFKDIANAKREEEGERIRRAESLILDALGDAQVYVQGDRLELRTRNPREKIDQGLRRLVENIYFKLNYVQDFIDSAVELQNILTGEQEKLYAGEDDPNKLALEEIEALVERRHLLNRQLNMKEVHDHFAKAPFGWNELDIAALIAKLAREQKIRLQYGGGNLNPREREIPDYLTKRTEIEKLVIRKRVGVPTELLASVRSLGHAVFHHTNLPMDEDNLAQQMKAIIAGCKNRASSTLARYDGLYGTKYPGKRDLQETKELLASLEVYTEPIPFFEALVEKEKELDAKLKRLVIVEEFFEKPKEYFDAALVVLELYDRNKQHLVDQDIKEIAEKIRAIVADQEPYGRISQLPDLRRRFNESFSALLEKVCKPIEERIERDRVFVLEELAKYDFGEQFERQINQTFETLLAEIRHANDLNQAYSMEIASRDRRHRAWDLIEQRRRQLEREKQPATHRTKPIERIKKVRLGAHQLLQGRVVLKSDQDIEDFLSGLRTKLSQRLKDNDEVEIDW